MERGVEVQDMAPAVLDDEEAVQKTDGQPPGRSFLASDTSPTKEEDAGERCAPEDLRWQKSRDKGEE